MKNSAVPFSDIIVPYMQNRSTMHSCYFLGVSGDQKEKTGSPTSVEMNCVGLGDREWADNHLCFRLMSTVNS